MADYIPIRTPASALANVPIVDGQIITVYDTGEMYVDKGAVRQRLADVIADTYANIISLLAPLANKLYFATDTHQLLQYSGGAWTILNSGGGGGSVVGDWGTRTVTANEKTSIRAVPNITMDSNNYVRGNGAVDLQMFRNDSRQIASGMSSFLAGRYSSAKGSFSFACGNNNQANAECSTVFGNQNISSGKHSTVFGNQTVNRIDGVVCNNNVIEYNNQPFWNVSGHCGFKGIKSQYYSAIPLWRLAITDVFIAKIHIICGRQYYTGESYNIHQIQNVVVDCCNLYRNEIEYSSGGADAFTCEMNNGILYLRAYYRYELQVGMFYTLYSQSGAMDSSSSGDSSMSGSDSTSSSSSGGYVPYYPDTSSSSS